MSLPRLASAVITAVLPALAGAAGEVEILHEGGPPQNRINVVLLGDGYTASEQQRMSEHGQRLVAGLFGVTPWAEYAAHFNVSLVHVESAESGADHPSRGEFRATAFDAGFDCGGIERLICLNYAAALSAAAAAVPLVTVAVVMVNDTQYGGSGGAVPAVSADPDAVEILRHELAHNIASLADEYEDPYPGYPPCSPIVDCFEPNVTLRTDREEIKWNAWIEAGTPLPTPEVPSTSDVVGLFEGARFLTSGIYRPERDCAMRTLEAPFCRVCTEALVLAIYDRVSPLDSAAPGTPTVLGWNERVALQVKHPQTTDGTVRVSWWVDGSPLASTAATIEADAALLGIGAHTVLARVSDETDRARSDPDGLLRAEATFLVDTSAGACGDGERNGPEACDDGNRTAGDGCSPECTEEGGGGSGGGGGGGSGGGGGGGSGGGGGGGSGGGGGGGSGGAGGRSGSGAGAGCGCGPGSAGAPGAAIPLLLLALRRRGASPSRRSRAARA